MCRICKNALIKGGSDGLDIIAKAIEKGRKAEHFDKTLDELLGTVMGDRDEAAEEAWENRNRSKG